MAEERYKYHMTLVSKPNWLDEVPNKVDASLGIRITNDDLTAAPFPILREAKSYLDRIGIKLSENLESGITNYQTPNGVHISYSYTNEDFSILEFITLESNSIRELYRLSNEIGIGRIKSF